MNGNKIIEEIQKVLQHTCDVYDEKGNHIRNKCNTWDCEYYDSTNHACCSYSRKEAIAIYDAGYRNCKDKVVLSKEIYEQLIPLGRYKEVKSLYDKKCTELKQVCKEILEKGYEFITNSTDKGAAFACFLGWIEVEFGVK